MNPRSGLPCHLLAQNLSWCCVSILNEIGLRIRNKRQKGMNPGLKWESDLSIWSGLIRGWIFSGCHPAADDLLTTPSLILSAT
jgi:hypothetical protein